MVESLARNAAISADMIATLNDTHDAEEVKTMLSSSLGLHSEEGYTPEQREVVVDFFFYAFAFTKEAGLTAMKASIFMSIAKKVLESDQEGPLKGDAGDAMKASFENFKKLVLSHSVERPPHSAGVFDVEEVSKIIEYMLNAYFRHYKLYRYIFTTRLATSVVQTNPHGVEEFQLPPRSLDEALPQAIRIERKAPSAPPEPPAEEKEAFEDVDEGDGVGEQGEDGGEIDGENGGEE